MTRSTPTRHSVWRVYGESNRGAASYCTCPLRLSETEQRIRKKTRRTSPSTFCTYLLTSSPLSLSSAVDIIPPSPFVLLIPKHPPRVFARVCVCVCACSRHSLHAISIQLSPVEGCTGIELLETDKFDLHCIQTLTGGCPLLPSLNLSWKKTKKKKRHFKPPAHTIPYYELAGASQPSPPLSLSLLSAISLIRTHTSYVCPVYCIYHSPRSPPTTVHLISSQSILTAGTKFFVTASPKTIGACLCVVYPPPPTPIRRQPATFVFWCFGFWSFPLPLMGGSYPYVSSPLFSLSLSHIIVFYHTALHHLLSM